MKTFLLTIIIIFFKFNSLFAQSGWFQLTSGTSANLFSILFVNDNTGYTVGDGTILKTTNAGNNWAAQIAPTTSTVNSIFFTDINTGFVTTYDSCNYIYKTTNGGSNWDTLYLPLTCFHVNVIFLNSSTGFISGHCGNIFKTTDSGNNWVRANTPNDIMAIYSLYFINMNTGYAADAQYGNILRTTNGGVDWQVVFTYSNNNSGFVSIDFADANTGIAVGGNGFGSPSTSYGVIFRTSNGGLNWSNLNFNPGILGLFFDIKFVNQNTGYIVGSMNNPPNGKILKTINGGINWYFQMSPGVSPLLTGISFSSLNTGYVSGFGGVILKTTDGGNFEGIKPINREIPASYNIEQNYPNPFNPATKITFQIPLSRGVDAEDGRGVLTKLCIYDILGREVETIVNEQLQPGTYELDFDGTNYPSGVYFYTLRTRDFTETKKMILVK